MKVDIFGQTSKKTFQYRATFPPKGSPPNSKYRLIEMMGKTDMVPCTLAPRSPGWHSVPSLSSMFGK